MRELRGEVGKLSHNWQSDRCRRSFFREFFGLGAVYIVDQWDRNKMDTDWALGRSSTSSSFSLSTAGQEEENELSYLSLLTRNRCRAGGQPTRIPIEYIKHSRAPVRSVDVYALVSLCMNVLK